MKVLYVVGTLGAGGLERFVTRIALRAHESNVIEPAVLCLNRRSGLFLSSLEGAGIPVYEAPAGWMRSPARWWALCRLLRTIRPDVVHSQVNFSLLQQVLATRAAGVKKFFVTERNCYELHGWARRRRWFQFHILCLLGGQYSANGRAVAEHLACLVNADARAIPVFPNGVLVTTPDPAIRENMRQKLGWSDQDVVIGYVARMAREKRHELFLQVVRRLREQHLPVKACLLGDGPQREQVKQTARALQLDEAIHFAGIVSDVEPYLQAFDIVALFSSREGMPNAVLEAMAAGKPVVATAVGAVPELLANGAGVVVEDATVEALSAALVGFINDPTQRQQIGMRAQERIRDSYSIDAVLLRLAKYYRGGETEQ